MHDTNAVMLHNGVRKLGSLNREQAPLVRGLLESWHRGGNDEDVIVVEADELNAQEIEDMRLSGSIRVIAINRVQERLARKFAKEVQDEGAKAMKFTEAALGEDPINKVLDRANRLGW